jgi:hypothetical protein
LSRGDNSRRVQQRNRLGALLKSIPPLHAAGLSQRDNRYLVGVSLIRWRPFGRKPVPECADKKQSLYID